LWTVGKSHGIGWVILAVFAAHSILAHPDAIRRNSSQFSASTWGRVYVRSSGCVRPIYGILMRLNAISQI